jgi:hypothetical protein
MLRRHLPRARRAVALISTVILTIIAAAIVLVITTQSIEAGRTASNQSDSQTAQTALTDARVTLASWLQTDPYAMLTSVSPLEDARVCLDGTVVQPGGAWPLSQCGTSWTYETPSNLSSSNSINASTLLNAVDNSVVQAQLQAPSAASPFLRVRLTAQYGHYNAAQLLTYRMQGSESYTVYDASALHLDQLASGCSSACSSLTGTLYSDSTIYLPTSSAASVGSTTQLESESGFSPGPPSGTGAFYYDTSPQVGSSGTAAIGNIRSVSPSQLTVAALRSAAIRNSNFACPGSNPTTYPTDNALTALCLTTGTNIPARYNPATSSAGTVTVPSGVTAYDFVFGDAGQASASPNTVAIYYSTSTLTPAGNCSVSCDEISASASQVAANQNPGEYSFWSPTLLGVFTIPRSGLLYSPVDAYLSLCASASQNNPWTTLNGSCPARTSGYATAGMVVGQSATVIAGSALAPANVYISGPVTQAPGVSFGAVATGAVIVPYWSRPPGTASLAVQGAYTALGYNANSGPAVETYPASVDASIADNVASSLVFTGSIAGPSVNLGLNMFSQVSPPYYTDFSGTWTLTSQVVVPTGVSPNSTR